MTVQPGETGVLYSPNPSGFVLIAKDRSGFSQMVEASRLNDEHGIDELFRTHQVIQVPNGVKVRVLDVSLDFREVRILDGTLEGQRVWVLQQHVVLREAYERKRMTVQSGETGVLYSPNPSGFVLIAKDRSVFSQMIEASRLNDEHRIDELFRTHQVIQVPNGVKVRVLAVSLDFREIRILDGTFEGQRVWVLQQHVVKRLPSGR